MQIVVIEHHYDSATRVYRLVVGYAIEREVYAEDGEKLETVTDLVPVEDFLLAGEDERWEGKSTAEIVKTQREVVRKTLTKRERDARKLAAEREAAIKPLPGAGESL